LPLFTGVRGRNIPGTSRRGVSGKLRKWLFLNILAAHSTKSYVREDRDVRSDNLVYILVVIILVLVALLLLSQLI
jgi:hypothetical protein